AAHSFGSSLGGLTRRGPLVRSQYRPSSPSSRDASVTPEAVGPRTWALRALPRGSPPDDPAGKPPARRTFPEDDLTADQRGHVAVGSLHEPAGAGGKVEGHLREAKLQAVEVDHIEVGLEPGPEHPTIVEAVERCRVARERPHRGLERDAWPP